MKKVLKWIAGLLVLAIIMWWVWSFFKPKEAVSYLTEEVKRGNISQTVSATGEIASSHLVEVGAQASGQIRKLHVKLGQKIKQGDLIAEIDSRSQTNTLNTNRSQLETYRAKLASAQIALSTAEKKYAREKALWAQDATSKQELEDAQDALASAKATITELKSSIKQTQISINTAETDLGYTRITAPMDGTVVAIPVEEGQTVNANQSTPTIIQLANLETMLNKMQIAEGDATKVKPGQKVKFTILSEPDQTVEATLETIDPGLTTMSQGEYKTSTDTSEKAIYYYARALVPNEDGKLAIGMTTQNTIEINQAKDVLIVPSVAIKKQGAKSMVRVQGADGQAKDQEITVGLKDSMHTEVKSGLKAGDKVILSEMSAEERAKIQDDSMRGPPR